MLAARVIGGDDGDVAQLSGNLPHHRPLCAVAVTTTAEDDQRAAGREAPRRLEHILQSIRRVCVVHDHGEWLSFQHSLKSPRHPGKLCQRLPNQLERDLLRIHGGNRGQGVVDVEPAVQPQTHGEPSARRDRGELTTVKMQAQTFRAHIGAARDSVGDDRGPTRRGHQGGAWIVGVDRGVPVRIHHLKECAFGVAVGLQRLVEIQVVLREISEHGSAEPAAINTVQCQCVRGHLHEHVVQLVVCHPPQDTLEVWRFGRGAVQRSRLRPDLHAQGADDSGAPSRAGQHRVEEVRGRAFAVRAGDPDERERA